MFIFSELSAGRCRSKEAAPQVHDQAESERENQHGSEWDVHSGSLALDADVPGKPAEPGEASGPNEKSQQDNYDTNHDKDRAGG